MGRRPPVVLVGDADPVLDDLAGYLRDVGYEALRAPSLAQAEPLFDRWPVSCVVLSAGRSPETTLDALRQLRDTRDVAILVLAAGADLIDRVTGLEIGADDVVAQPVATQEIVARIGGILARRGLLTTDLLRLERSTVDLAASRLLRVGQAPERLGHGEITLLRALVGHPRQVLSRDDLMSLAPAESREANDRAIDTRVARLRRKLDTDAIVTVRGHGYMYVPPFETGG